MYHTNSEPYAILIINLSDISHSVSLFIQALNVYPVMCASNCL